MFKIDNLTIETVKGRKLIDNLTFALNSGDKLAIIGEEGNGKSTLLKAIANKSIEYCKISGKITQGEKFGYLEQKLPIHCQNKTVFQFLTDSDCLEPNYEIFNNKKLNQYFSQFGFDFSLIEDDVKLSALSGGEQVKMQIIKILLQEPSILLLDEPTNDLDIETLEWLENFINQCNKPIIFVSHDETLLEHCANMILHLEQLIRKSQPKHTLFKGGYLEYVSTREKSISKQTQIALAERREKEKKEQILRQIKEKVKNAINATKDAASARIIVKKMASVKAQERKLNNSETTEIPDVEENIKLLTDKKVNFPNQKELLNIHIKELTVPNKELSKNVDLHLKGAQKVAIIGRNGCGKSTLLKTILPVLSQTPGLKVGYFSQNYYETLDYNKTPIEELNQADFTFNAQTFLGSLKFTMEEMNQKISNLSEGQKAKLLLLKLIVEKNNVLVLDEPTRNLSPLSNPVIRQMLNQFNGAIIAVSHDRKFIKCVCNKVLELTANGLKEVEL